MIRAHTIELDSGRSVECRELHQKLTYEGLLEGEPSRDDNDKQMRGLAGAELRYALGGALHLIEPEQSPPRYAPDPHGVLGRLPAVTCIGRFESEPVGSACASTLVIIWFQHRFALPIEEPALSAIRALPWEKLAFDFDL
ncbi:MAG TPA: hypothetical protein PLS69_03355 [Terricaulis sp.]|nr:hypothetical protein [Terricaulis sp.]HRP09422.1 hypothetical protein [Terricaulis sp.]